MHDAIACTAALSLFAILAFYAFIGWNEPEPTADLEQSASYLAPAPSNLDLLAPCDCLSCQTGRPDYPCLIEDHDD